METGTVLDYLDCDQVTVFAGVDGCVISGSIFEEFHYRQSYCVDDYLLSDSKFEVYGCQLLCSASFG